MRRATTNQTNNRNLTRNFYPRSPCGERLHYDNYNLHCVDISIHALLAESDKHSANPKNRKRNFYPRSPCGERPSTPAVRSQFIHFYPRSPCGERLVVPGGLWLPDHISIHALLAESDGGAPSSCFGKIIFLSTLSLRRATASQGAAVGYKVNFYPRSPCGERPPLASRTKTIFTISIHALLAESDFVLWMVPNLLLRFLSTLSLRRATGGFGAGSWRLAIFLSTLSLRRATHYDNYNLHCVEISIHALLAESDVDEIPYQRQIYQFLSTLSLRRATQHTHVSRILPRISIHALLAESD